MRCYFALALLAVLAGVTTATHEDEPRLVMKPLGLLGNGANGGGPERMSGYFKLARAYDAHMFFFYFAARIDAENAPVVLWMTGGPGCSSELAVFFENGPWHINPSNLTLEETKHGWDLNHHMIFVDQPINTGFSWSEDERDTCYDEACVSSDMVDFLGEFFKAKQQLQGRPFYVTGESYAGHYVPAVASAVYHASRSGEVQPPINLQGLAIGNGLTDPAIQYGAYSDYALQNGLIGQSMHDGLKLIYPACRIALEVCDSLGVAVECLLAVQFCQMTQFAPIMMVNPSMNVYDIRKECKGALCYEEFEVLDRYLNQASVREELRVMIYAGDQDLICNYVGNRQWVDVLPWRGAQRWALAPEQAWSVEGDAAGTVKAAGPLSFVVVHEAGHMVPMDQARAGLDMITRFTRNKPLAPPSATQGLLPGATWKLRRAMPGRGGQLSAAVEE